MVCLFCMRAVPRQTRVTPGDYAVNVAGLDRWLKTKFQLITSHGYFDMP